MRCGKPSSSLQPESGLSPGQITSSCDAGSFTILRRYKVFGAAYNKIPVRHSIYLDVMLLDKPAYIKRISFRLNKERVQ